MELILNLAWVLVAVAAVACWSLTYSRADAAHRRIVPQLLALGVLLLILFPAISITDDLRAVRNPAETDILARRHDEATHPVGVVPHRPSAYLPGVLQPLSVLVLGYVSYSPEILPLPEATSRLGLFIRPPPAL